MGVPSFMAWGDFRSSGSHSVACKISLAKSVQSSEVTQNSLGHGEPPKVSHRLARPHCLNMIKHLATVSPLSAILLYAALMSVLHPNIFVHR